MLIDHHADVKHAEFKAELQDKASDCRHLWSTDDTTSLMSGHFGVPFLPRPAHITYVLNVVFSVDPVGLEIEMYMIYNMWSMVMQYVNIAASVPESPVLILSSGYCLCGGFPCSVEKCH